MDSTLSIKTKCFEEKKRKKQNVSVVRCTLNFDDEDDRFGWKQTQSEVEEEHARQHVERWPS